MNFTQLLEESVRTHGHLCAGQIIGVRMAILGCELVGIPQPKASQYRKKLLVFVEIDRCATDAIASVTGCQLGKRTLKFKDFGINAATFLNTATNLAYRIISTEESRKLAERFAPANVPPEKYQLEGYLRMPDYLLFKVQQVNVPLSPQELPGPPRQHAICHRCGQKIRDGRELLSGNTAICRPCSDESYFQVLQEHPLTGQPQTELFEITL
jgi:formylmethanofuran dehydrogenase subunit E